MGENEDGGKGAGGGEGVGGREDEMDAERDARGETLGAGNPPDGEEGEDEVVEWKEGPHKVIERRHGPGEEVRSHIQDFE